MFDRLAEAMVSSVTVSAIGQLAALRAEADRRGISLPSRFDVPDRGLWQRGYAAKHEGPSRRRNELDRR